MDDRISKDARTAALVAAALDGTLTDAQAAGLAALDPRIQKLAWVVAAQRIAEQNARIAQLEGRVLVAGSGDPNTPSGQKPPYAKPPTSRRRQRRSGCPIRESLLRTPVLPVCTQADQRR